VGVPVADLVLYHASCPDGFTAAWAAWRKFGDAAEYLPVQYGPGQVPPDVTGRDVLILDFSYPRALLLEMYAKAKSLRVLDHHVSAQKDLAGLDFCVFDMERSGAGLAWDELHDREQLASRPDLVDYVEDRDLWRFKLPDSRAINAYIGSFEFSFEKWTELADEFIDSERIVGIGEALLRGVDRYVASMAKQARLVTLAGYVVPCVNAPYLNTSELVGHLAEQVPEAFAVGWFQRGDGLYQYSLRSQGSFDVSELAKQFGGGGHRNAAGFTVAERVEVG
jgi:hypothetical protein